MKVQRRTIQTPLTIQRRDEGEGVSLPIIRGHAAVFNEWTTLYNGKYIKVREKVSPGAFRDAIRENQDVRFLFNHNYDYVLARTKSKTLTLEEDETGLAISAEILDSQRNREMILDPAKRGDISGMSFAFAPRENGVIETRRESDSLIEYEYELTSVDLFDVSIVSNPAYQGASFDIRSEKSFPDIEESERLRFLSRQTRKFFLMNADIRLAELSI